MKSICHLLRHSLCCLALCSGSVIAATFPVTNIADDGAGSLREAIALANAAAGPDVVDLSAIAGSTIDLSSGQLDISGSLTIEGSGVEIDANITSRVFSIVSSGTVTINDTIVRRGFEIGGDGNGGGVRCESSNLSLNNVSLFQNQANAGGGVFALNCLVSMNETVIEDNQANDGGGAWLESDGGSLVLANTRIGGNSASAAAGGLAVIMQGGEFIMTDSEIDGNIVDFIAPSGSFVLDPGNSAGLALDIFEATATILQTTFRENQASGNYAGLGASVDGNAQIIIDSSTFSGNTAGEQTGGVFLVANDVSSALIVNSTISGNTAGERVGGSTVVSQNDSDVVLSHLTIVDNQGDTEVGGLEVATSNFATLELSALAISDNMAAIDPDLSIAPATGPLDVFFSLLGTLPSTGTLNTDPSTDLLVGEPTLLAELLDNGGPTLTHLPFLGSPLLDQIPPGDNGCGTTINSDQRNIIRPAGIGCDIGAVEGFGTPPPPPPPVISYAVDTLNPLSILIAILLLTVAAYFRLGRSA